MIGKRPVYIYTMFTWTHLDGPHDHIKQLSLTTPPNEYLTLIMRVRKQMWLLLSVLVMLPLIRFWVIKHFAWIIHTRATHLLEFAALEHFSYDCHWSTAWLQSANRVPQKKHPSVAKWKSSLPKYQTTDCWAVRDVNYNPLIHKTSLQRIPWDNGPL